MGYLYALNAFERLSHTGENLARNKLMPLSGWQCGTYANSVTLKMVKKSNVINLQPPIVCYKLLFVGHDRKVE